MGDGRGDVLNDMHGTALPFQNYSIILIKSMTIKHSTKVIPLQATLQSQFYHTKILATQTFKISITILHKVPKYYKSMKIMNITYGDIAI
jgi:hypothetical protein